MLELQRTTKGDPLLQECMKKHYSQPKGFVGRQLFYRVVFADFPYGVIAWGSAVRHLPNRPVLGTLNNGLNNIFYHVYKVDGVYPLRNFTSFILTRAEEIAAKDYAQTYGDRVLWFESLVELPRSGELYRRAGWREVGETKGYTCKRITAADDSDRTDSWKGFRFWDTENLRPKRVFVKERH